MTDDRGNRPSPPSNLDGARIITLLDGMLRRAIDLGASDVHLEPKTHNMRQRFRLDGVLVSQKTYGSTVGEKLVSRIKVLAHMDIAERRCPQDGHFEVKLSATRIIAVRCSTFPTIHGEKVVMRLLGGGHIMRLEQLGADPTQVQAMRRMAHLGGGLVLVTGPTGSGKTSTLYALLAELDTAHRNVMTLEDPVEVHLAEVNQGQVHRRAGFGFAEGLRAILRQDPDVILVGEMRDAETTEIAIQASLTGHLVLSTLHTNSTIETIVRLTDIGIEPYFVANAVVVVVAQRLARRLCLSCSVPADPEDPEFAELVESLGENLPEDGHYKVAKGCIKCMDTGYQGRVAFFEIMELDDGLRELVKARAYTSEMKRHVNTNGVPTLRMVGLAKAAAGITSLDEVMRVT